MRHYISSLELGLKQFARAARRQWSIENSLHWSLDVTCNEDPLRQWHQHLRQNFAGLDRLTVLKQNPGKLSLAM